MFSLLFYFFIFIVHRCVLSDAFLADAATEGFGESRLVQERCQEMAPPRPEGVQELEDGAQEEPIYLTLDTYKNEGFFTCGHRVQCVKEYNLLKNSILKILEPYLDTNYKTIYLEFITANGWKEIQYDLVKYAIRDILRSFGSKVTLIDKGHLYADDFRYNTIGIDLREPGKFYYNLTIPKSMLMQTFGTSNRTNYPGKGYTFTVPKTSNGGALSLKKSDRKKHIQGRERVIYVGKHRKEYVRLKGTFVPVSSLPNTGKLDLNVGLVL